MPPRIPGLQCLRASNSSSPVFSSRSFSSAPSSQAVAQRRRRRDPYTLAQARARKAANLSRQEVLQKERAKALGDPVRGVTTPFLESFDTALPSEPSPPSTSTHNRNQDSPSNDAAGPSLDTDNHLNFFLTKDQFAKGLEHSRWLSTPPESYINTAAPEPTQGKQKSSNEISSKWLDDLVDNSRDHAVPLTAEQRQQKLQEDQDTASEALRRIASLSLGSSKDRLRVNVQRCINVFGRHNTDQTLPPRPSGNSNSTTTAATDGAAKPLGKAPRVGPDTGSSEVQIAILTAKIRTLADFLDLRGGHDKANKRNLRLLVHRRAKLLKYFRKRERAGPRWRNLVETLGLTEGTWKDQISI